MTDYPENAMRACRWEDAAVATADAHPDAPAGRAVTMALPKLAPCRWHAAGEQGGAAPASASGFPPAGSGDPAGARVALAPFLRPSRDVVTLGVRPGMADYSAAERRLLLSARRIFFPTRRFVAVFQALGLPTFPSAASYHYQHARELQGLLFQVLALPHLHTRIYYGASQKQRVLKDFSLPVTILPTSSGPNREVEVSSRQQLTFWLERLNPVLVRASLPLKTAVRLIWVHYACLGALPMTADGFECPPGGSLEVNDRALTLPLEASRWLVARAQLDDVAIDWGLTGEGWRLLRLARPPRAFATPGGRIDRHQHLADLIRAGVL